MPCVVLHLMKCMLLLFTYWWGGSIPMRKAKVPSCHNNCPSCSLFRSAHTVKDHPLGVSDQEREGRTLFVLIGTWIYCSSLHAFVWCTHSMLYSTYVCVCGCVCVSGPTATSNYRSSPNGDPFLWNLISLCSPQGLVQLSLSMHIQIFPPGRWVSVVTLLLLASFQAISCRLFHIDCMVCIQHKKSWYQSSELKRFCFITKRQLC